jgi:N-acetylneuraminic acid mutarotase
MKVLGRREIVGGILAGGAATLASSSRIGAFAHPHDDQPVGVWSERTPMPFAVQEIYPARFLRSGRMPQAIKPTLEGVLVNAGGLTDAEGFANNVTDLVTVYDPIANEWTYGPSLPEPRHHIAHVFHNGFLYAIGGFRRDARGGWQMQNSLWRIEDLAEPGWTTLTPPPIPQAESVAVSLGGRIHVVGGRAPAGSQNLNWGDHIDTDHHWAYDSRLNRWESRAPIPTPRNSAAGAVVDGLLFVIGGRTVSDGNTAVCEVYEPTSDRWQQAAPLPAPIRQTAPRGQSGLAAAVWNGKIYAFGGEWFTPTSSGVYADVWEYDPRQDKWRAVAAMNRPRHGLGAVALADGVYACGGATGPSDEGTSNFLDRLAI